MTKYTIKPLEWIEQSPQDFYASTPWGVYEVFRLGEDWWRMRPIFGQEEDAATTLEAAKLAAESHWRERVTRALEECR